MSALQLIHQTITKGFGHRLGFRVDLQLFVDVSHVERNCIDADVQLKRSGLVVVAFNQQFEQTSFVRGQFIVSAFRWSDVPEESDHAARHFR